MSTITPVVPEALKPMADENFYEVAEVLAAIPLDSYAATMPDARPFCRYNRTPAIHAAVYEPHEYDPKHAVFSLNPFGNGHQPHMDIRNRAVQHIAAPNAQLVSFPNNTAAERYYELNQSAQAVVASGDATPLAESIHATAEEMGLETIDVLAYSQGAFVGVALMQLAQERGVIRINNALIAEPTNVVRRTPEMLRKQFMKTGLFPLIAAVKDSNIPALVEAQSMRLPRDVLRLGRSMLGVQRGSKLAENIALHEGMTHDNLAPILFALEANDQGYLNTRVTMARAEKSKITPYVEGYAYPARFVARQRLEIDGYGHEAADNVTGVYALLAKLALQSSKTS